MDKQRLMELAGVALTEEKMPAEEQMVAQNTYKVMNKIFDDLEKISDRISHKSLIAQMGKLGLVHERESLEKLIQSTVDEFNDFMPGLEMMKRGE